MDMDPPSEDVYAITVDEPVALSYGTAAAGASTTITLATTPTIGRTYVDDDYYNNARIYIASGTGSGQTRTISDYAGSTRIATVSAAWGTNPDATSVYSILDDLPLVMAPAIALRAAVNISRVEVRFENSLPRFLGEYERAEQAALAALKQPATASADAPREAERWEQ
jgi:hypothetical protein